MMANLFYHGLLRIAMFLTSTFNKAVELVICITEKIILDLLIV